MNMILPVTLSSKPKTTQINLTRQENTENRMMLIFKGLHLEMKRSLFHVLPLLQKFFEAFQVDAQGLQSKSAKSPKLSTSA